MVEIPNQLKLYLLLILIYSINMTEQEFLEIRKRYRTAAKIKVRIASAKSNITSYTKMCNKEGKEDYAKTKLAMWQENLKTLNQEFKNL